MKRIFAANYAFTPGTHVILEGEAKVNRMDLDVMVQDALTKLK